MQVVPEARDRRCRFGSQRPAGTFHSAWRDSPPIEVGLRYRVRLEGDLGAAARLAPRLQSAALRLVDDVGTVYLESTSFEPLPSHAAVFSEAQRLMEVVRGAMRVAGIREATPLAPQAVFELDEQGGDRNTQFIVLPTIVVHAEAYPPTVIVSGVTSAVPTLGAEAAIASPAVAHALTLFAREPTWVELYKVMEVVADDVGGLHALDRSGFIDAKERDRFSQTANSMHAAGHDARHAAARIKPPEVPMSLGEATALIRGLLGLWMLSKLDAEPTQRDSAGLA